MNSVIYIEVATIRMKESIPRPSLLTEVSSFHTLALTNTHTQNN